MINLYEWCIENNRDDILLRWSEKNDIEPTEISYGSPQKVWWKCSLNHEWQTSPNKITQKKTEGCPYCSGQKVLIGFNDLRSNNPKIADEWHPFKNGNLKAEDVTSHSNKKVWWKCSLEHEFQAVVGHRTRENRKSRCPYCANKKVLAGFNDLETICSEIVTEWDKEKNGNLLPNEVLPSTNRKIWWKCKKGHEWEASLNSRIQNGK